MQLDAVELPPAPPIMGWVDTPPIGRDSHIPFEYILAIVIKVFLTSGGHITLPLLWLNFLLFCTVATFPVPFVTSSPHSTYMKDGRNRKPGVNHLQL